MDIARTRSIVTCAIAAAFVLPAVAYAETLVAPNGAVVTTPTPVVVTPAPAAIAPGPAVVAPGAAVLASPPPLVTPAPAPTRGAATGPVPSVAPVAPAYDDLDAWVDRYSLSHGGYVTREDYLREMARRWDAADIDGQGLTPADMSRLTGRVDTNALAPLSGTGVQPGNMGPGNSRGE